MGMTPTYEFQTRLGGMLLRQAEPTEEATVLAIMRDGAMWLQEIGIPQWQSVLKPDIQDLIRRRVNDGSAYLAFLNGEAVGTISLFWTDTYSWNEKGADGSAGYIHGFSVLPRVAGKGIGKDILNWSVNFIKSQRPLVRLDCMAENTRLCRYYEEAGFSRVGQTTLPNGFKVNLYENR